MYDKVLEILAEIIKELEDRGEYEIETTGYSDYTNGIDYSLTKIYNAKNKIKSLKENELDELKSKVNEASFDHYFECGEYVGEDTQKKKIVYTDEVLKIIDEMK